jgi:predicted aspartyl protease
MVDIDASRHADYGGHKGMGHVHQRVKLSAERTVTVRMLVDTGATYSVIPESLARAVGIKRLPRSVPITLAATSTSRFSA